MTRGARSWNDVRGKGYFVAVLIAFCSAYLGHAVYLKLIAKAPGESHCYGNVCHRVHSLEETRRLIGTSTEVIATHYDAPGVDKYNVGQYTSSGEEFDAENASRAAAVHYPDGTELLVWHAGTRRAAHIRVNDFGPFMGKRTLDVTRKVAETMGWAKNGVATLKVTVIWVPQDSDPKYKKGRVYPPSLGLIGVVEPYQYDTLAQRLIATGPARNGLMPGPTAPDVPALLAGMIPPPPNFRSESDDRIAEEEEALARMIAQLPPVTLAQAPSLELAAVVAVDPAPLFRVEVVADAGLMAAGEQVSLARVIAALPPVSLPQDLPAELTAPVVIATVIAPAPAQAPAVKVVQADTGSQGANQSTVQPSAGVSTAPAATQVAAASPAVPVAVNADAAPVAASAETPIAASVTVASARAAPVSRPWTFEQLGLWIGIGLMLSTLWGARSWSRARQNGAAVAVAVAPEPFETVQSNRDPLAVARLAAEKAEARARAALADEENRAAATEADLQAREDLARELALREFEREQEATTRARVEAASAAHEAAQRELAALEASRTARRNAELARQQAVLNPPSQTPASQTPASQTKVIARGETPAVRAPKPVAQPAPLRALANDSEMARFSGIADRALVGGILGLPGALNYWGNTIIAQMRLDGSARSGSPLRIDGTVDGACTAPVLLISEGAVVTGVIAAETIVVLGKVSGILAGRNIYVASSAQVDGEIYYQTMAIDPQAHCDVSFSRLPQDADPVELGSTVYAARAAA